MSPSRPTPLPLEQYTVGAATVTRLTEIVFADFKPGYLFPEWSVAALAPHLHWLVPDCLSPDHAELTVSVNTWIVQTPRHTVLIDTGIGNGRARRIPAFHQLHTPYLERLAAAGIEPGQVTHVLNTHLHSDHVGWNTRRQGEAWVPTFCNARYLFPEQELKFAQSDAFRLHHAVGVYEDSIAPVLQAGLVDLVDAQGGDVLEGFRHVPTPGHTPGHMSIELSSGGDRAIFTGDVMHNPLQVWLPHWNSVFCGEQEQARRSRLWLLERAAETAALLCTAHFPRTAAGWVRRQGDGFEWQFA